MRPDRSAPVLLVTERATVGRIVSDMLRKLGFETVETARDGATALQLLRGNGPRLIIADLHMEALSGLQLLRTIRSDDRLKRSPFIVAAETLTPSEAVAVKHAGVDGMLLKPFSSHMLEQKIEAAIRAKPKPRVLVEPKVKKSLSAALGRRFERHKA
jgi:two-component system chemotaxis response regulator CheY